MELSRIETLLVKYFEADTSTAEEQELQHYFSQENVAPHLEEYRSMFAFFSRAKEECSIPSPFHQNLRENLIPLFGGFRWQQLQFLFLAFILGTHSVHRLNCLMKNCWPTNKPRMHWSLFL